MRLLARCEFAMKASNCARASNDVASAAWQRLANDASTWVQIRAGGTLEAAIELRVTTPPALQSFSDGWPAVPRRRAHRLARAINAAVRVHLIRASAGTPRRPPGRDAALVQAIMVVVTKVVEQNTGHLKRAFNHG